MSAALLGQGSAPAALNAARRARSHGGGTPAEVKALAAEAVAAASMGHAAHGPRRGRAAEAAHASSASETWGTVGYPERTYHRAHLLAFDGWSLTKVGLFVDAAPRLAEAAELAAGTGLMVFLWLDPGQRGARMPATSTPPTRLASMAVASLRPDRPRGSPREIRQLESRVPGAFADLVEIASRWRF